MLGDLAIKHNTDKGPTSHNYTSRYELYLDQFRELEFNLLEIGVFDGGSARMWKEYFPKATIVALDIDPRCKEYEEERLHIRIGDQTDQEFLSKVVGEFGHFEVILDDGGHSSLQQIVSFETLFPLLTPGGLYFIEDMHTSYVKGSRWDDHPQSGVDYFKGLVDDVNVRGKSFTGYNELPPNSLSYLENNVDYLHFYKSLVVINKKNKPVQ
tara:strand:- start:667 stop:1299 length:633 start_codon:yes stop_codon:yes gene_type:complete